MHKFNNLKIWKEGMNLVSENYKVSKTFPKFDRFGLESQMNRSAISIPSNIAEGSSKSSNKHFKAFLEHSLGSAFEWETQLTIAYREDYITESKFSELLQKLKEIQKMISGFKTNYS